MEQYSFPYRLYVLQEYVAALFRQETIRFEESIESYLAWLRGVHIMLTTPSYEDENGNEKRAIIVDIDGVPLDISGRIDEIMLMSKEHFKLLAKQFGKSIYEY